MKEPSIIRKLLFPFLYCITVVVTLGIALSVESGPAGHPVFTGGGNVNAPSSRIGAGSKHDGFITRDSAEVQTTDATQTTVDSITLLDENTYYVEAWIVGVQSDGSDRASYKLAVTAFRTGAGGATLLGTVKSLHSQESDINLAATFTVSGNDLIASVTGIAAETWEWGATLFYINVSN